MIRLTLFLVVACLTAGCSGSAPTATHADGPLAGPWMMEVVPTLPLGTGNVRTVLFFEPDGDSFEAHSRPGAVRDLVGALQATLASAAGGESFSRGALVHIYDGTLTTQEDARTVTGRLVAQGLGEASLEGTLANGRMTGTLRGTSNGVEIARFDAMPYAGSLPLQDYSTLAPAARALVSERYFAPRDLESDDWADFWTDLEDRLGRAQDDMEALAQFRLAAGEINVSHFGLQRASSVPAASPEADPSLGVTDGVRFERRDDGVAVLTCLSFSAEQATPVIERAFAEMDAAEPEALVVDLRGCSGGDFSGMGIAAHLLSDSVPAGLFVANRWWDTNTAVPARSAWSELEPLTEPSLDAFFRGLDTHGALVARVEPLAPTYSGPVYVLTSGASASAAEPLAYVLKQTGRATLIGAPTAGAMLASLPFPFADGWVLRVPVADYYTAEGTRLEGVGVTPTVEATPEAAMGVALARHE